MTAAKRLSNIRTSFVRGRKVLRKTMVPTNNAVAPLKLPPSEPLVQIFDSDSSAGFVRSTHVCLSIDKMAGLNPTFDVRVATDTDGMDVFDCVGISASRFGERSLLDTNQDGRPVLNFCKRGIYKANRPAPGDRVVVWDVSHPSGEIAMRIKTVPQERGSKTIIMEALCVDEHRRVRTKLVLEGSSGFGATISLENPEGDFTHVARIFDYFPLGLEPERLDIDIEPGVDLAAVTALSMCYNDFK